MSAGLRGSGNPSPSEGDATRCHFWGGTGWQPFSIQSRISDRLYLQAGRGPCPMKTGLGASPDRDHAHQVLSPHPAKTAASLHVSNKDSSFMSYSVNHRLLPRSLVRGQHERPPREIVLVAPSFLSPLPQSRLTLCQVLVSRYSPPRRRPPAPPDTLSARVTPPPPRRRHWQGDGVGFAGHRGYCSHWKATALIRCLCAPTRRPRVFCLPGRAAPLARTNEPRNHRPAARSAHVLPSSGSHRSLRRACPWRCLSASSPVVG